MTRPDKIGGGIPQPDLGAHAVAQEPDGSSRLGLAHPRSIPSPVRNSPELAMAGRERADYGAIVSFENPKGQTLQIHREGPVVAAVRQACAIAMIRDESFRVVSISTPSSIFGDLSGRLSSTTGENAPSEYQHPEPTILSRANCLALLHPRLQGQSRQSVKRRRA